VKLTGQNAPGATVAFGGAAATSPRDVEPEDLARLLVTVAKMPVCASVLLSQAMTHPL
jgi:hypothetical protein